MNIKNGGFTWHCPWETTYALAVVGGCGNVQIDCSDNDRVTRILEKYTWIGQQTGEMGPEIGRADINTYAQCCVQKQCRQGPECGAVPVVQAPSLFDSKVVV